MAEGGGVQVGNGEREWQYERLEQVLELVSYILQCYLVSSEPPIEQCNV